MIDREPTPATTDPVTCKTCKFLGGPDPTAGLAPFPLPDPGTCSIRSHHITDPGRSFCANHPERSPAFDPIPVGPVMGRGTGTGDSNTVVHASPDSQRIREHLIDIIEQVQVVRREDLTPRQAAAIWQLEQFRERRAYVQLDRIAGDLASSRESVTLWFLTPGTLEAKVATHLIGKIAGRDVTPAGDRRKDIYWIERFTIPGRMLLLASMLAGGASIYFTLDYVTENAAPGSRVPVYLFVVVAFVGAAAFLTAGVFAFRLLGIPFLTAERDVGRRE